jgi:exodeoxyribonuclease VII large subunit
MEGQQGRISLLAQRLKMAMLNLHQQRQNSLDNMAAALAHLNPHSILARGFAIVRADDGKVVSNVRVLNPGASVTLELSDGQATARILATHLPPDATNSPETD